MQAQDPYDGKNWKVATLRQVMKATAILPRHTKNSLNSNRYPKNNSPWQLNYPKALRNSHSQGRSLRDQRTTIIVVIVIMKVVVTAYYFEKV